MYLPEKIEKILCKIGYVETDNIAEFWFDKRNDVWTALRKKFNEIDIQRFEAQIRWKSEAGIVCQREVRNYIERLLSTNGQGLARPQVIIDFTTFSFQFNNQTLTLDDFQRMYTNPRISPEENLMGIDLSGIKIDNCIVKNAFFAYANFTGAQIGLTTFDNCSLHNAIFENARFGQVRFIDSSMAYSNVEGAFFNALAFNDENVNSLKFEKVSYFYLIKCLLITIFSNDLFHEKSNKGHKHTIFLSNDTKGLVGTESVFLKSYIEWYQYIFGRLRSYKKLSFTNKILFSLSLLFTKGWTSYGVLASYGVFVNVLFAGLYMLNDTTLKDFNGEFLTAFYYSVVTFTTLGYGEITPTEDITKVIVMIEVVLGYLTLGSFVFLIGHKVNDRY